MSRLYAIGLAAVVWLAVIIALAGLATPTSIAPGETGQSVALSDLVVGGVPGNTGETTKEAANRNPFRYAPTFQKEAYTNTPDPGLNQGLLADLDMTLEGVQARAGIFTAFINYRGERRPLRQGDHVGDHLVVAHIGQDRIRVVADGNESRWIYLAQ